MIRLALTSLLFFSMEAHGFRVVVDPGHGGTDRGAVRGGVEEAELVLSIAQKLKKSVPPHSPLRIELTRESDRALTLSERTRWAESRQADLFISLHANTAPGRRAQGMEIFFQNSLPPDEEAFYLASLENQAHGADADDGSNTRLSRKGDVHAIVEDLHRQSRMSASLRFSELLTRKISQHAPVQVKQAPFYVLAKSRMPSILLEVGFLSNPQDLKKLTSSDYQEKIVRVLHDTIEKFSEQSRAQRLPARDLD